MGYIIKIFISSLFILLVSEIGKKDAKLAGLLLALPIIPLITYSIIYFDSQDTKRIAEVAYCNFLFTLPVVPGLFGLSYLLKIGVNYFTACVITLLIIGLLYYISAKIGFK